MDAVVKMVQSTLAKIAESINSLSSKVGFTVPVPKVDGIANPYKGAAAELGKGVKDAFSEALGTEYIADPAKRIEAAISRLKSSANAAGQGRADDANEMARRRGARGAEQQKSDGLLTNPLKNPAAKADGGGGGGKGKGGGGAEKDDAFDKELANIEKRIEAFNRERAALGLSREEAAKAEATHKLLDAAKAAEIPITDELKSKIDQLATSYAGTKVQLDQAKDAQQGFYDLQKLAGTSLSGFFSDVMSGGKNASEALMNLTKKLADAALQAVLLGEGPLGKIFGMSAPGGKGAGGLIGMLFGAFGGGGGAGAPMSLLPGLAVGTSHVPADMPAMLHKGEMVIPKYDASLLRKGGAGGGSSNVINLTINDPTGDAAIERKILGAVNQSTRMLESKIGRNVGGMMQNWQTRYG